MAEHDLMTKSLKYMSSSEKNLQTLGSGFDSNPESLYSLSTNINRKSNLTDNIESQKFTASLDSLNHYRNEPSRNFLFGDDISMTGTLVEEEKEDDFERDLTMEVGRLSPTFRSKLNLRKRMSCLMLDKTDSIEDIDSNDANEEGVDCDVIQLKKSNSISMTKRQSKLERLKSENFSDIELSEAIGTLSPAKKSGGPALKDRTDKFLFLKNRLSPRKNTSFKNIFSKRYSPSKLSPWVKKENPFLKVNKEVIWGAQEKSSKDSSSFSEKIDDKLYKQISHFTAYEPSLELVDKNEKHKKAKFTISCHTLKNLMKENQYEGKKTRKNLVIIDCRYDYEYSGGHIMGAINHNNPDSIYEELFPSVEKIRELMEKDSIIVLHCEFSQCRAPMTYDWIRKKDRELNGEKYPLLFYPELYVLENGYKEFYGTYPEFCEPQGYVPMDKKEFRAERDYFEDLRRPYCKIRK